MAEQQSEKQPEKEKQPEIAEKQPDKPPEKERGPSQQDTRKPDKPPEKERGPSQQDTRKLDKPPEKKRGPSQQDTRRKSSDIKDLSRLNVRKPSYGFGSIPGVRPIERTSQVGLEFKRPILVYLPTYQLDSFKPFHLANVLKIVEETLDELYDGHKYHEMESPALAVKLAGETMRRVKAMGYNRYRIISIVTIGQKRKQSYNNSIGLLWDYERDGYVDTHREMISNFVQVTLFGIYLD